MSKPPPRTLVCVVCEAGFTVDRYRGQKTCSLKCRRKRRNQMVTAWRDTHECPDHKHGTLVGYINYQCPCDECRQFASAHRQKNRVKARAG